MPSEFTDVNRFWNYIHDTKANQIRTIIFETLNNRIKLLRTLQRCPTSADDVQGIHKVVLDHDRPVWFLVRCDFSDSGDGKFKLGFTGLPSANTNRFVSLLASSDVGYLPCGYYGTKNDLEERIWEHLFPWTEDTTSPSCSAISAVVVEGSNPPHFKLIPSTSITTLCRRRQAAYVLIPTCEDVVRIHMFHPEGVCSRCRVRTKGTAPGDRSRAILAFMKPELIPWLLISIYERFDFIFAEDVDSCADLPSLVSSAPVVARDSMHRRRSNESVLSPPTMEKYTGPSKRTRNFPDHSRGS